MDMKETLKLHHQKKEATYEHDPTMLLSSLDQSSFKMDWEKMENCSVVRQTEIGHLFWNMDSASRELKMRGTTRLKTSAKFKNLHLWWHGGPISVYEIGSWHIWKGTINTKRYIQVLENTFSHCIFQQNNAKPHTASITALCQHCSRRNTACLQCRPRPFLQTTGGRPLNAPSSMCSFCCPRFIFFSMWA